MEFSKFQGVPVWRLAWVIGVFVLAVQVAAMQSPPPTTRSGSPPPGVHGPSVIPLRLAPAISTTDLDRYARWLSLSAEQRAFLKDACTTYAQSWSAVVKKEVEPLERLSESAAGDEASTPGGVALVDDFVRRQKHLRDRLEAIDESLFVRLESALSPEQITLMPRVRLDRQREVGTLAGVLIPASAIDLTRVIEPHLGKVKPGLEAALDEALVRYEVAITPHFRDLSEALVEQASQLRHLAVRRAFDDNGQRIDPGSPFAQERREQVRVERIDVLGKSAKPQEAIATLNQGLVSEIATYFPEDRAADIKARFDQLAYPAVYPDPLDPTMLFGTICATEGLSADERDSLEAAWSGFRDEHARLSDQMVERFMQWRTRLAHTQSSQPHEVLEYRSVMRELRDRRWAADAKIVDVLLASVNPTVQNGVAAQTDEFKARFQALTQQARNDGYPGG
jgi:hypothetical protein